MTTKYDGTHCPRCGETLRIAETLAVTGPHTASQEVVCDVCPARFNEAFEMVVLEQLDEDGLVVAKHEVA